MKTLSRRALLLYAFVLAFLVGFSYLFFTFYTNSDSWAMKRANRHLYTGSTLTTAGTIKDEKGVSLAETIDGKRVFNKDKTIRMATLHTVGDSEGYISTGIHTSYKDALTGYNFVDGVYDLKKYGKGSSITLSINAELCATAYSALGKNKGTVGVYNYKTGQLLCVTSNPSFDIQNKPVQNINNDKTGEYEGVYLNRFFSGVYTPGSTFKIITAACAIENIPDIYEKTYTCTGEYKLDGSSVKCLGVHGKVGLEKALNVSCNSAFGQIAVELGAEKLMATATRIGFNAPHKVDNIDLSKSSIDLIGKPNLDVAWAGIGQLTTRLNPCHMLTIVGAIANGGTSPNPYLINTITSPAGKETYKSKTVMGAEMFKGDVAKKVSELMRSNVKNYYGESKFPNLKMCGKTGTAEVSSEKGGKAPHAWFVGFSQREDLPLAIVVIAENGGFGNSTSVPIANKVMQKALSLYGKDK
ncbi:MAG: penicillin-binding transpeptidase domain-containing protein [Oscillospiraceae bacterium]